MPWLLCFSPSMAMSAEGFYSTEVPVFVELPTAQNALDQSLFKIFSRSLESGLKIREAIPDFELSDPFPLKVSGVTLSASARGRAGVDQKGPWIEGWIGSLEIQISRLAIDTVILREVAGVRARIQLKATCRDIKVIWGPSEIPFFARTRLHTEEKQAKISFDQFSLSTIYDEPRVALSCEGPIGAEEMMRTEFLKAVLSRWTDPLFLADIRKRLESSVTEGLMPGGKGFAGFRTMAYEKTQNGARLKGALKVSLDRPIVEVPIFEIPNPSQVTDTLTIRVAIKNLESLAQSYFAPGIWSNWTIGQDVEGFRDLMDSRFKQFFAFPDLLRYSKDAPFAFSTSIANRMELACDSESRQIEARADIGSWMVLRQQLQQNGNFQNSSPLGFKPIVYFRLPSRIRVGEDFRPRVMSMSLSSQFHQKYVAEESPNTTIAHDTILESLQPEFDRLLGQSVDELGILQLTRGLELRCETASGTAVIRVAR